jgi:ankyrin repeat protein/nucleoside-triphosphatase THEP1
MFHQYVLMFASTTDICKVAGDGLAISQKALDIQQKEHEWKLSDQQAKCLQLFRLTKSSEDATYEWYKERIVDRVEGTCMWFLDHPHFQEWKRKESGPLLVSADPGCGKSVLAKYLIDHVLAESATVCYFFFKDQVQNTVRKALCALLHQLFSQRRSLLVHAMKQYDKDGAGLVNSTSSLWSVFREAVQDANAGSVTIVLDALDECAESETQDLMRHMEIQARNSESSNAKLKLFMTSRPYEHVMSELYSLSKNFPRIRIPGEDESETISQEVNCVIRHRVDQFAEEKELSDETKTCLADQLLKMEHRTYLWVYLVFDYLKDFYFKRTPKGIASTFNALPKSVSQAYEQILNKSKDRLIVQKALAIILAATRPLTLAEMSVAMEVEENTKSFEDLDLEQEHDFKSRLRSWCGLFISVHHGRIYFLHQTAREFLLAERQSSTTIQKERMWHGFTTMKHAHTVLAECCVRFLHFYDDGDRIVTKQVQDVWNEAFREYSAKFWALHVRESSICDDEGSAIAPLTFKLSDPHSGVYRMWSEIYSRTNYRWNSGPWTRLIVACYFGHVAIVKQSLEEGADVNAQGGKYGNALQAASSRGDEQIVKLLLNKGADINAQGGRYRNALQAALLEGYEQTVKLLLDKGADVNAQGGEYGNALQAASSRGDEQTVKLLLDKGADVNAQGGEYGNALQAASSRGDEQIVKLLLDKSADVNAQGGRYRNALQAASLEGYEQIVKLLLDKGADINAQGGHYGNALYAASSRGDEQTVKLLLNKGADVNAQGGKYGNAFQAASLAGHEAIVRFLYDNGADMQAKDSHLRTALHYAARGGHTSIFNYLVHQGLNPFAVDAKGDGLLCYAASGGHVDVLEAAFNEGLTVNSENEHWSPLHWACRAGHAEAVELLAKESLRSSSVSGGQTKSKWSPFAIAVFHSNQNALENLSSSCIALLDPDYDAMIFFGEQEGYWCSGCLNVSAEHNLLACLTLE